MTMQNLNMPKKPVTRVLDAWELSMCDNLYDFLEGAGIDLHSVQDCECMLYCEGFDHGSGYTLTDAWLLPEVEDDSDDEKILLAMAREPDSKAAEMYFYKQDNAINVRKFFINRGEFIDTEELAEISKRLKRKGAQSKMMKILAEIEKSTEFSAVDKVIFETMLQSLANNAALQSVLY